MGACCKNADGLRRTFLSRFSVDVASDRQLSDPCEGENKEVQVNPLGIHDKGFNQSQNQALILRIIP